MTKKTLDTWLGVIGNVAVVIGLFVVAMELRQNSIVANGELSSQFQTNWEEIDRSRQEPSFAAVYAKSIERPAELTLAEQVQLDGYYWSVIDQLQLAQDLVEAELFYSSYEEIGRSFVRDVLITPYAQAWWHAHKDVADPATVRIVDDELERISPDTAQAFFNDVQTTLSE